MALKYHPDRNHGKQESGSSNKFSSDAEFEKFKEMFEEVEREFKETKREFYEYKENKKQEDKAARSKAIRDIEEALTLSNVSISELDSSLWSPYSDMRIDINRAKRAKINNSGSGQRGYTHGSYSEESHDNRGRYGDYDKPLPNFSDRNFSPCLSGFTSKSEKQKCRQEIAELEGRLKELQKEDNSNQPNFSGSSSYSNDSDNKNETIEQLKAKIEQSKNNKR
nr:12624_t:CDS:2 [Entrophospora candida]